MATTHRAPRGKLALLLIALLLAVAVPAQVISASSSQSISATITSPANGSTFTRLDTIGFAVSVTHSNCPPASYAWRFGDSAQSSLQNPSYRYSTLGTFDVSVKVSGSGSCTKSSTPHVLVHIVNIAPVAALAASGDLVAGATVTLSAAGSTDADGTIAGYVFTIDGLDAPEQASATFATSFAQAGTHDVSVRARDDSGDLSAPVSLALDIVAGPLAHIAVAPSAAELVVGGAQSFAASGTDAHGNAVAITPSWSTTCGDIDADGALTAHTAAGVCAVTASVGHVAGAAVVTLLPDALQSIQISGPATVAAGHTAAFALAGYDAHGNAVALAQDVLAWTAPTTLGTFTVEHAENDVTGALDVTVVADALHAIAVTGPATMVAGTEATFALAGSDQHGNPVALAQETLVHLASTTVGEDDVCYTESGVTGCAVATIVADILDRITITGPATVVAGTSATYALAGHDQYGNAVPLLEESVEFTAPTTAGEALVTYAEGDVEGTLRVIVLPDELFAIAIVGPDAVRAGSVTDFALEGFDQYGNGVELAQATLRFVAPIPTGPQTLTYTERGVTGTKDIAITAVALDVAVSTERALYSPLDALGGIQGAVRVAFPGSIALGGASVVLEIRQAMPLGGPRVLTLTGVTDAAGRFAFELPLEFRLPGEYELRATVEALGHAGAATGAFRVGV